MSKTFLKLSLNKNCSLYHFKRFYAHDIMGILDILCIIGPMLIFDLMVISDLLLILDLTRISLQSMNVEVYTGT